MPRASVLTLVDSGYPGKRSKAAVDRWRNSSAIDCGDRSMRKLMPCMLLDFCCKRNELLDRFIVAGDLIGNSSSAEASSKFSSLASVSVFFDLTKLSW